MNTINRSSLEDICVRLSQQIIVVVLRAAKGKQQKAEAVQEFIKVAALTEASLALGFEALKPVVYEESRS